MTRLLAYARRMLLAGAACLLLATVFPTAAQAASCGPATGQGTAPADFRTYCWLDFSGYNDTTARNGGQNFSFNLPDGTTVSMKLTVSGGGITTVAVPSWSGSAFGNVAFTGIPGKPILYTSTNATTVTATLSGISVTPPTGGSATYSMIVGDGESSNDNEALTFTTSGGAWQQVAQIPNGSGGVYPGLAGVGTTTVTETGVGGTVGSYVFRTDNNPTQITATMKAGGLQGIIVGLRYASISVVSQIASTSTRYNPADQFTYALKTDSGLTLASGTTSGAANSGFPIASVPTVAASYPFVVSQAMAPGSVGTLANYTTSLSCTNANAGTPRTANFTEASSTHTFTSLQYNDAVLCTFTNTPIFNSIAGTVYKDANHNGGQDGSEAGPGVAGMVVKLAPVSGGACTAPATQAVAVDATTGAYTLPNLPQGTYCVILDDNSTLADVTPTVPAGWVPTQNASGSLQVNVAAGAPMPPPQLFGLYNGSRLTGTVFGDTGVGAGTPNNGVRDGTESGLGGITVNASAGASAVATAVTAGDGGFTLWVPASASTAVTVVPTLPSGYLATSGSAGSTGGSYTRPSVSYQPLAGSSYTGVTFGMALPNTLAPNGAQTAQPGTVVFYPHTFQAGSGGQVTFSLANASDPASPAWTTVLYADGNCNTTLDGGEAVLAAPMTVAAGQQVCLVVKQFVPAGAAFGASNNVTLTAAFTYTNASPALSASLTATDVTTGGEPTALSLKKLVSNVTRSGAASTSTNATPGDVLQYTLTAQNNGGGPVSTLVINDATPAFTSFLAAACPGSLPAGVTACAITTQPAAGAPGSLQWTFSGTLAAGAQLAVTYQVKLSQ